MADLIWVETAVSCTQVNTNCRYNEGMSYLVRAHPRKQHPIAHRANKIDGTTGALCSQQGKPSAGDWSKQGEWQLVDALPPGVRLCHRCQRIQQKIDDPLPKRVKQELEMLARWDARAASIQRAKMIARYRPKQKPQREAVKAM